MKSYPFKVHAFWQILNLFVLITMSESVKNNRSPIIVALPALLALVLNLIWIKKERDNWSKGYKIAMGIYVVVLILFTIFMVKMSM
ncbi:hypothetical protein I6I93_04195 [Peptoniphilus harei]|uniref:Uncharacterized protein n=1 Tax=Peptoniphilus harei TaxID=54005 RepID=A0A2X1ZR60_9FIRM|nr:hypothetical protein [Peptoniphilus harei]QQT91758.1 hypothetical protein I6I93_04195 [Peptoniphilus harei]SPY46855.1 Uncharacterised protein [Peptoniphilus harei]